jgi:hypothetical protein
MKANKLTDFLLFYAHQIIGTALLSSLFISMLSCAN